MRILLDTHILLWQVSDDPRLTGRLRSLLSDTDNEIIVSDVTIWEVVIKHGSGKLATDPDRLEEIIAKDQYERLPIRLEHIRGLARLPTAHRDPFDRLLIAQAINEDVAVLTADRRFTDYPVALAV